MSIALSTARNNASPLQRTITIAPIIQISMGRRSQEFANVVRPKASCIDCAARQTCLPSDLNPSELAMFEDRFHTKRRIRAGQHLYRAGDASVSIYALRSGFIRTSSVTDDGREQVTGFHMLGEVIGVETIAGGIHGSDAVALEDTEVCEFSLNSLQRLSHELPTLQRKLFRMVAERFQYEREVMLLMGSTRAEDRVASFLLNIGRRYAARGFSAVRFILRMSRGDIGSYLCLRLETVSRLFSKFQAEGLLSVDGKSVEILDPDGLRMVIGRSFN